MERMGFDGYCDWMNGTYTDRLPGREAWLNVGSEEHGTASGIVYN